MMTILQDYYNPKVLEDGHTFSKSGIYKQLNPELEYAVSCVVVAFLPDLIWLFILTCQGLCEARVETFTSPERSFLQYNFYQVHYMGKKKTVRALAFESVQL